MNWSKLFSMLLPVISALLAALTANNVSAISMAADPATGTEVGVTGLAGFGSLITLIGGMFATWRAGGGVSPTRAAEVAALSTLAATCMARGDGEGNRLVGLLAEHFAVQSGDKENDDTAPDSSTVDQLLKHLEKKLRLDAAKQVEGTA